MRIKQLIGTAVLGGVLVLGASANATLLTDGDFDSLNPVTGFVNGSVNIDAMTNFNVWITAGTVNNNNQMWSLVSPGAGGAGQYAMHNTRGNGGDERLAQIIDATGFAVGKKLFLTFDYLNDASTATNDFVHAYLIGFLSGTYSQFGGPLHTGGAVANVLASTVPLANTAGSFTSHMLMGVIDQPYKAVGVVFRGSCFVSGGAQMGECDGPRGVDNVDLTVPEPGALALFGLGLAGLGLARRRRAG